MKVYIAGAITNNMNYVKQFNEAEERLVAAGYSAINPIKNQGYSYKEYIDIGLYELMHCDAIYMLEGWEKSTGATLEHTYAEAVGLTILTQGSIEPKVIVQCDTLLTKKELRKIERMFMKRPVAYVGRDGYRGCPCCAYLLSKVSNHCPNCGQAIEWR